MSTVANELSFKAADEVAALIRNGSVSAKEVVEEFLRRIEAIDPDLNAFIEVDGDRVLAEAERVKSGDPRPFAGVPIAVKGAVPVAGYELNFGSKYLEGVRPTESAYVVRRLRDAGFVVIGITNLCEFALLPTTEAIHTGATRNPWSTEHTPGGSSGGSAVAVAAGMVPIAHGTDGGGSIRIPAACCGVVGLKPSRGRISWGPTFGDEFLACNGVLARTVSETAIGLDVMAGYEVGDSTWSPPPAEPYSLSFRRNPGPLRIAITSSTLKPVDVHPECLSGMESAAQLLQELGHEITEVEFQYPPLEVFRKYNIAFGALVAPILAMGEKFHGRSPEDGELEPLTEAVVREVKKASLSDYIEARRALQLASRQVVSFFSDYDVLLTPALAERPLKIGELNGSGDNPLGDFTRSGAFTPFTSLFNVTGQPAITVPVKLGGDGMPTSVQLVGRPLGEDTLLQVASQIEAGASVGRPPIPFGL